MPESIAMVKKNNKIKQLTTRLKLSNLVTSIRAMTRNPNKQDTKSNKTSRAPARSSNLTHGVSIDIADHDSEAFHVFEPRVTQQDHVDISHVYLAVKSSFSDQDNPDYDSYSSTANISATDGQSDSSTSTMYTAQTSISDEQFFTTANTSATSLDQAINQSFSSTSTWTSLDAASTTAQPSWSNETIPISTPIQLEAITRARMTQYHLYKRLSLIEAKRSLLTLTRSHPQRRKLISRVTVVRERAHLAIQRKIVSFQSKLHISLTLGDRIDLEDAQRKDIWDRLPSWCLKTGFKVVEAGNQEGIEAAIRRENERMVGFSRLERQEIG